ncbi:MAG TPA: alpha/beta hydrolase [Solirubrobacteraceae bacterium]|nr:alpha/beta hydrolase [Solirubrobacteraceae bacterium]
MRLPLTSIPAVTPPLPEVTGVSHRFVIANGVRLHVAEAGSPEAPPLLLVHGWPQHWWMWRLMIPDLARTHRLICPDLRGLGWSEQPAQGYEKETLAADMMAVLDELGIERASWLGHDWGAFCGLLAALRHPDRIERLMVLSVPHLWPSREERLNPRRMASFAYQLPLSAPVLGARLMRAGATRQVLRRGRAVGHYSEHELRSYDQILRTPNGARATVGYYRSFVTRELPAILTGRYSRSHLRPPTRLLIGTRDPIGAGAKLDGPIDNAPGLEVEWVPGAGHFLPEERPDLVAERAQRFFAPSVAHA